MAKFPPIVSKNPGVPPGKASGVPGPLARKFQALIAKKGKAKKGKAKAVAKSAVAPTATAKERALNPLSTLIARDKKRARPVGRK